MTRKIFIIAIIALTSITSCTKTNNKTSTTTNNNKTIRDEFQNSSFLERKKTLKNDKNVIKLNNLIDTMFSLLTNNKEIDSQLNQDIAHLITQLNEKYGEDNLNIFMNDFDKNKVIKINKKTCLESSYNDCDTYFEKFRYASYYNSVCTLFGTRKSSNLCKKYAACKYCCD